MKASVGQTATLPPNRALLLQGDVVAVVSRPLATPELPGGATCSGSTEAPAPRAAFGYT